MFLHFYDWHFAYPNLNSQNELLYRQFWKQQILYKSNEKPFDSNESNPTKGFNEEGRIDVKPFLDPSDGGTLGQEKPNQISLFFFLAVVTILVVGVILNSLLSIFRSDVQIHENPLNNLVNDPNQQSSKQNQVSQSINSGNDTLEAVSHSELPAQAVSQEQQPSSHEDFSDSTIDISTQEGQKVKHIFKDNQISKIDKENTPDL